jgi:hypothetical protein
MADVTEIAATPRSRATVAALGGAVLLLPLLAGCDLGHPGGFTAGSNSFCGAAAKQISKLTRPTGPKQQLQYATDRYTVIEHLVSEMTDSSLPGGTEGAQVRDHWLRPARASLADGRSILVALRAAANDHDAAAANAQFVRSLAIGTDDVDTALLRAHGLTQCAEVFEPTPAQPVQA